FKSNLPEVWLQQRQGRRIQHCQKEIGRPRGSRSRGRGRHERNPCDARKVTYYTGHETIIASGSRPGMARWREQLFAFMHHNAQRPGAYFKIPSAQVMEIGIEFEM